MSGGPGQSISAANSQASHADQQSHTQPSDKPPSLAGGHLDKSGKPKPGGRPPFAPAPDLSLTDLFANSDGNPLQVAFPKKSVVHPFVDARPVAKEAWSEIWQDILEKPRHGKSVAYFHIPFCENHCLFCGFYQNPWHTDQSTAYADAVIAEMKAHQDCPSQASGPIHAVYFGGGTPTALDTKDLCRILEAAHTLLPLASDCEVTLEGRIFSFSLDKAKACFSAGANRISLGVQSFDSKLRRRLGRKVDGKEAETFLRELVGLDQGAIVIDLMYGFPDQSIEGWQQDVEIAASLGLDGVDLYSLNLIKSTPLAMTIEKGKLSSPPDHSQLGLYYQAGAEILDRHGWYGISTTHWRRTTRERNLYNLLVKTGANCLAFGSGAGGYLDNHSFRIDSNLTTYLEAASRGEKPLAFMMRTPDDRDFINIVKGQMETGRLHHAGLVLALNERNMQGAALIEPVLSQWQESGLLIDKGEWAELTLAGRFWQVTMTQKLIQWIQQHMRSRQAA